MLHSGLQGRPALLSLGVDTGIERVDTFPILSSTAAGKTKSLPSRWHQTEQFASLEMIANIEVYRDARFARGSAREAAIQQPHRKNEPLAASRLESRVSLPQHQVWILPQQHWVQGVFANIQPAGTLFLKNNFCWINNRRTTVHDQFPAGMVIEWTQDQCHGQPADPTKVNHVRGAVHLPRKFDRLRPCSVLTHEPRHALDRRRFGLTGFSHLLPYVIRWIPHCPCVKFRRAVQEDRRQ
jgi:hypothetical protein